MIICNKIKNTLEIPSFFQETYISSIPKQKSKGSLSLETQRGKFVVNRLKSIFMRLLYNSNINQIEKHLADSNIGGQKNRSARDHLFILHLVINECKYGKSKTPTDITFKANVLTLYGQKKTFIDLYKNGVQSVSVSGLPLCSEGLV